MSPSSDAAPRDAAPRDAAQARPPADAADAGRPALARPVWAGVVASDLDRSARWYAETLGASVADRGAAYAVVRFRDGSRIELFAGDPARPGGAFPSYHDEPGPPVLPGFHVADPVEVSRPMVVARWLPEWVVVVGPGGLRAVLCTAEGDGARGLVGFDVAGPDPAALTAWFGGFGAAVAARAAERLRVVPVVAGHADVELADPDGTPVRVVG